MKKIALITAVFTFAASSLQLHAAAPKSDKEKISYTIGFQIASGIKRDNLDIDIKALTQAISDVLGNKKLQMTQDEMKNAMNNFRQKKMTEMKALADSNKKKGDDYLAKNRSKKGVKETASGLQYKVITKGSGPSPTEKDKVTVHYRGTLIDGTEFDSSYKRGEPVSFAVNGVIKGWQEALQLMSKGAKWEVVIPSHLAYGPRGAGPDIGPNETLLFTVELLDINK